MLKLVIKHKIFEYALNNMFNKLSLNFKRNLINLKVGDKYKTITHNLEDGRVETYYNGEVINMNVGVPGLVSVSFEKYTHSSPEDAFAMESKIFESYIEKNNIKHIEIDYHNKEIVHYPTPTTKGRYLSIYQITSIVK